MPRKVTEAMPGRSADHLSPQSVEEYFRQRVTVALALDVDLQAVLEIDPPRDELRLLLPASGADPEVTSLERLRFARGPLAGRVGEWFTIGVDSRGVRYEAYSLLESILDVARSGASIRHAVAEAIAQFKGLLAARSRLSEEKEAGLIGELIVLRRVVEVTGEVVALESWLGPRSEEHDFGFEEYDAEIKTTRSENRLHLIGSESQLSPQPDRALYLISLQITLAGAAEGGFTLPDLVDSVRSLLSTTQRTLDAALAAIGWRNEDRDLYRTRFQLRSVPRAYLVDDRFPAITRPLLDSVVPQPSLVSAVSYRVDVTAMHFSTLAGPLADLCEGPQ